MFHPKVLDPVVVFHQFCLLTDELAPCTHLSHYVTEVVADIF